ncbi:MAG: DMT family transporter [Pseudomonadota bacterium]
MSAEVGLWARQPANLRGAVWMTLAACGFTLNAALVKSLSATGMDVFQIAFARALFALAALLPLLWRSGVRQLRTRHPWIHFLRSVSGALAMLGGFYAITVLPLAAFTALSFTTPLFTVVMAVLLIGERVRWRRWSATGVGFLGVLIMVRPGAETFELAALIALGMAFGIAFAVTLLKRFPEGESQVAMLFYFSIASILVAGIPAAAVWQTPSLLEWGLLAMVGLLGVASQALLIRAYRTGEASFVAPFDYTKLLLAGLLGFLLFGEVPDATGLVGAAVIVASTVYIARREAQLKTKSRY